MAAPARVNSLAARKRQLVEEAAAHRGDITAERLTLQTEIVSIRSRVWANRWWVLGGAVAAGVLVMRVGAHRLLPAGLLAWRLAQQARGR